jgi:hypothetical protein
LPFNVRQMDVGASEILACRPKMTASAVASVNVYAQKRRPLGTGRDGRQTIDGSPAGSQPVDYLDTHAGSWAWALIGPLPVALRNCSIFRASWSHGTGSWRPHPPGSQVGVAPDVPEIKGIKDAMRLDERARPLPIRTQAPTPRSGAHADERSCLARARKVRPALWTLGVSVSTPVDVCVPGEVVVLGTQTLTTSPGGWVPC